MLPQVQQPIPLDSAIEDWLESKYQRTRSERTRHQYQAVITSFRNYLAATGIDLDFPDSRILRAAIQQWASLGVDGGEVSTAYRNNRIAIVSSFYRFTLRQGTMSLPINPAELVERSVVWRYAHVKFLDNEHVQNAMASIDRRSIKGKRDYALLSIAFTTGMRASEIVNMRTSDLRLTQGTFEVTCRVKGGEEVRKLMAHDAAKNLMDYLEWAYQLDWIGKDYPLWRSIKGRKPFGYGGIRDVFQQYLHTGKVHTSRHTFSRAFLEASRNDVIGLQHELGHANLATTNTYTPHVTELTNPHGDRIAAAFGITSIEPEATS